ncbi:formylmethanofuran dehydrogenase [Archaeoglobales archaeon]|nr:MAG: formylmethanofuran dehydrogenase [Archaeoglobales archaeon]
MIVLEKAKEFHGHLCPFVALGVKASIIAMEELGVERIDENASIEEDLIAIVECNNCFVDGVQIATGCTFGNNSLIYFDLGKNALSLVKRGVWEGVRVYIDADGINKYFSREANELFEKVVVRREGDEKDKQQMAKLWEKIAYKMLDVPRDDFKIERVRVKPIEQAPIFKSVRCSSCNELVMETKIVFVDGKPHCLRCAGKNYHAVVGRGIVEFAEVSK